MAQPVTLVTGASSGLGAAFGRACAARGERLVLVARRRGRLEALAEELGSADVVVADLALPGAAAAVMREVEGRGLVVSTLINNAGFGLAGTFADLPGEGQRAMIALNIATLADLTHAALPGMLERRRGAILNVASTGAFQAGPGFAIYFATKAFVLSFTEALHQELLGSGVHVSALCPGPTRTEFGAVAGGTNSGLERFGAHAEGVVRAGLRGLDANQAVVIPGLLNKLTAQSNRLLPRALMRRIVASLKL